MAVNQDLVTATKESPEYRNGVAILGQPDDYAAQTMLEFIGYFYVMTIRHNGNIEGLDAFVRDMGIEPVQVGSDYSFSSSDEDVLTTVFTYIVGRNSKEYFEEFLKHRAEVVAGEN